MRLRRLQRQDEQGKWYDDAYAFEDGCGQIVFRYNLTWERVGSLYNQKLQETKVSLDAIESVLQPGERFQWLPTENVADNEVDDFLEVLDKQCAIPKPHPIALSSSVESVSSHA